MSKVSLIALVCLVFSVFSVCVFAADNSNYFDESVVQLENPQTGDLFGYDVVVDKSTLVTVAKGHDAIYVFDKPTNGWSDLKDYAAKIQVTDNDGILGISSFDFDADTIVIGVSDDSEVSPQAGAIYIFHKPDSGWKSTNTYDAKLTVSDIAERGQLGLNVSIDGDTLIATAMDSEYAGRTKMFYLFEKAADKWESASNYTAKIIGTGNANYNGLGENSFMIVDDTIYVDVKKYPSTDDFIGIFVKPDTGWASTDSFSAMISAPLNKYVANFGSSLSVYDDIMAVGANLSSGNDGSVLIYKRPTSGWSSTSEYLSLINSQFFGEPTYSEHFGSDVLITADSLYVGAPMAQEEGEEVGALYIFMKPTTGWQDIETTPFYTIVPQYRAYEDMYPSTPYFNSEMSFAVDNHEIILGCSRFDDVGAGSSGAIFIEKLIDPENGADLSILLNANQGSLEEGDSISVTAIITNLSSENDAKDVVVDISNPAVFELLNADDGCELIGDAIECGINLLTKSGGTSSFEIGV